jgi:hypothetical protein
MPSRVSVEQGNGSIQCLGDFLANMKTLMKANRTTRICFRGLDDAAYKLVPPIGREYYFGGKRIDPFGQVDERDHFLHRFRRETFVDYRRTLEEWEALFLARHHGLPVRLLDWTFNPLAALYFACASVFKKEVKDGKLWALIPKPIDSTYIDMLKPPSDPLAICGVKLIYPYRISERINAQRSVFTIQNQPDIALEDYPFNSYADRDIDVASLTFWLLQKTAMGQIIDDVLRLGVNAGTLFPELDGICAGLVESEIVKKAQT